MTHCSWASVAPRSCASPGRATASDTSMPTTAVSAKHITAKTRSRLSRAASGGLPRAVVLVDVMIRHPLHVGFKRSF